MIGMTTLSAPVDIIDLPQPWMRAALGFCGSTVLMVVLLAAIA